MIYSNRSGHSEQLCFVIKNPYTDSVKRDVKRNLYMSLILYEPDRHPDTEATMLTDSAYLPVGKSMWNYSLMYSVLKILPGKWEFKI